MSEDVRGSITFARGSEPFYDLFCQPCTYEIRHLEAHGFCQDCQKYLCQACYDSHRKHRPTRHHCLLNKNEMPKTQQPSTVRNAPDVCTRGCEKHPDEMIKYHCPKHDDVVCGVCVTLSHLTCGVTYIPDLASGIGDSDEYKELNQALLNCMKITQDTIDTAKKNLTNVQQSYDDALEDVQQIRKEINEMMDLLESRIRTEMEVLKSSDEENMNATSSQCESLLLEANALQIRLKTLKDQKQEYNLFLDMKKTQGDLQMLQDRISHLHENNHVTHYMFNRSDNLWDFMNNTSAYGKLVQKVESTEAASVTHKSLTLAKDDGTNSPTLTGMVLLKGDTLVAVESIKRKIYVFDINNYTRTHVESLPHEPWGITRVGNESVAVTFPYPGKVICYTLSHGVQEERNFSTTRFCHGIDYHRERFYVTFCDSGTDGHLEVLDRTGNTLTKIHSFENSKFVWPVYISVHSDTLFVSDSNLGTVIKMQKSGKLEWIYSDQDLRIPLGVTVDQSGSVIVCAEKSGNIHKVSADGKHGRVLLSQRGPQAVAFCRSSGQLFITQDPFDKLIVYRMYYSTELN